MREPDCAVVYDSARSFSGEATGRAGLLVVKLLFFCSFSIFLDHLRNFLVYMFSIIGCAWTILSPAAWYRSRTAHRHSQYVQTFKRVSVGTFKSNYVQTSITVHLAGDLVPDSGHPISPGPRTSKISGRRIRRDA